LGANSRPVVLAVHRFNLPRVLVDGKPAAKGTLDGMFKGRTLWQNLDEFGIYARVGGGTCVDMVQEREHLLQGITRRIV
jgi:hypothetical protein